MIVLVPSDLGLGAETLLSHAETQASMLPSSASEAQWLLAIPDSALADVAVQTLRRRAKRSQHLPAGLFGEGGWEILLELFVSEHNGARMSLSSACVASQMSQTTAVRYIAFLVANGLVQRSSDPKDIRNKVISLTAKGLTATRAALKEFVCGTAD